MNHLTKSAIAELEQCEKRLWLSRRRPELAATQVTNRVVDGHRVGALARTQTIGGVLVGALDPAEALEKTGTLLLERKTIFEAALVHDDVFVRVDILAPDGDDGWRLIEVKASSGPKSHHYADLATQVWVAQQAGLKISSAAVRHLNTAFRHTGEGLHDGLLVDAEAMDKLGRRLDERPVLVTHARAILDGDEPPRAMSDHCDEPNPCPFSAYCEAMAPEGPAYPVTLLPSAAGKKAAEALRSNGFEDLRDVPDGLLADGLLRRIQSATR